MHLPVTSFWDYSNAVYHKPGVERALLTLQQRLGIDVNFVLFCFWAARHRHIAFDVAAIAELVGRAEIWQAEAVRPLRRLRQSLKSVGEGMARDEVQALREQVQELELRAEHIEQNYLEACVARCGKVVAASESQRVAIANVKAYFRFQGLDLDASCVDQLNTIVVVLLSVPPEGASSMWRESPASYASSLAP